MRLYVLYMYCTCMYVGTIIMLDSMWRQYVLVILVYTNCGAGIMVESDCLSGTCCSQSGEQDSSNRSG